MNSDVGTASLVHNKAMMQAHWVDSLKQWFKDGVDTDGIEMIHVKARSVKYWQGEEQDEAKL